LSKEEVRSKPEERVTEKISDEPGVEGLKQVNNEAVERRSL
jgi:hypothetical protein